MYRKHMLPWYGLFGFILVTLLFLLAAWANAAGCDSTNQNVQCVPLAQVTSVGSNTDTPTPTATITDTSTITATTATTATTTLTSAVTDTSTITATIADTSTITATATITPTATPKPTPTPSPTPKGDSPETARDPLYVRPDNCIDAMCPEQKGAAALTSPANWTWIDANSSTWYKMDDGHSFQLKVWLFANGQKSISFEVFAPEQKDLWTAKPIGRGSFDKNQANIGTDLFYSGRSQAYGIWYVRVINSSPAPVSYSIRFTRTLPTMSNVCDSCHKLIGTDWGSCQGNMCAQLHQYYDTNPTCYSHDVSADMAGGCP